MSGPRNRPSSAITQASVKYKISMICIVIVLLFMTLNISFLLRTESAFIAALTEGSPPRTSDPGVGYSPLKGNGNDDGSELDAGLKTLLTLQVVISLITGGAMIVSLIFLIGRALAVFQETGRAEAAAVSDSIYDDLVDREGLAARAARIGREMDGICSGLENLVLAKNDLQGALKTMTAAMGDIARNTAEVCRILSDADQRIKTDSERMDQLVAATQKAGNLMALITQISQQIDLLALNANIEFDRAGEEGENFMALIDQIKNLAWEAAEEVEEINSNINGAQSHTTDTIAEIGLTRQVISKAHLMLSSIEAGIRKQSENNPEITARTREIFNGLDEISEKTTRSRAALNALEKELHR